MSNRRTTMVGLLLLTAANLFQVIGTYAADWNETHIYNRNWPPHAKFHNAQTMAMAAVLAVASLIFIDPDGRWGGHAAIGDAHRAIATQRRVVMRGTVETLGGHLGDSDAYPYRPFRWDDKY